MPGRNQAAAVSVNRRSATKFSVRRTASPADLANPPCDVLCWPQYPLAAGLREVGSATAPGSLAGCASVPETKTPGDVGSGVNPRRLRF